MRFPLRSFTAGVILFVPIAPAFAQRADSLALSMEDAIALALRTGEEARLAAAQVELADAQIGVTRATALPQLRITAGQTHVLENARAQAVGQIFNQPNTYTSNANLSQILFQGGRTTAASHAASRTREAARLSAEEIRAQVNVDVQRAYVQVLYAERLLEIRRASLRLAAQRSTQVEAFEKAGRAAHFDVLTAHVERGNLEPQVVDAGNARDLALLELKRLTNIPAGQALKLTTTIEPSTVQVILTSVTSDSLQADGRASIRAAELVAHARRDAIAVARADFFPTLTVFIQSGFQAFPPSGGFPTSGGRVVDIECPAGSTAGRACTAQNGGWFSDRSLGVTFSWPVFDGLRTKGNLDVAEMQARIADIQLATAREAVATDIARARASLASAKALFAARTENAAEAREAFSLASLRFERGVGTQLEISSAQLASMQAQTDEARSVYDLYLASVDLARALGHPIPMPAGRSGREANSIPPQGTPRVPPPR
jgi:outer membrane protein TolC